MKYFYDNYDLKTLIGKPTCYKNSENCLYRFNAHNCGVQFSKHRCDRNEFVDFHLITLTVMRKEYRKFQPIIISYRSYKHFSSEKFRKNLSDNLSKVNLVNDVDGFQKFCDIVLETLNKHVPCKQRYV